MTLLDDRCVFIESVARDMVLDALAFQETDEYKTYQHSFGSGPYFDIEFNTIRVGSRRSIGHTQAVLALAETFSSIIFVKNHEQIHWMIRRMHQRAKAIAPSYQYPHPNNIFSCNSLNPGTFRGRIEPDLVLCIVDDASTFSDRELDQIYQALYGQVKLFALIG